jgi:single-strand DNA-binding protein
MNAPTTAPGHPEAKQDGPAVNTEVEDLGPGHIMGNLTEDPELRYTPSGRPVTKIRIAYRDRFKDPKTEKWTDGPPEFYTLNVWGNQAERCAETFAKGDRVVAAGSWSKRPWVNREGEPMVSVELTVKDIGPSLLFKGATIERPDEDAEGARNDT